LPFYHRSTSIAACLQWQVFSLLFDHPNGVLCFVLLPLLSAVLSFLALAGSQNAGYAGFSTYAGYTSSHYNAGLLIDYSSTATLARSMYCHLLIHGR
jgi:hypothetical protein